MILHLLRHAEAEDVSPSGRDQDRRLTDDGRRRAKAVAKAIAGLEPGYDAVLVSPSRDDDRGILAALGECTIAELAADAVPVPARAAVLHTHL